jgi:hypothetical protein
MFSLVYRHFGGLDRRIGPAGGLAAAPETAGPPNSAPAFMGESLILSTLMLTRFVLTLALSLV